MAQAILLDRLRRLPGGIKQTQIEIRSNIGRYIYIIVERWDWSSWPGYLNSMIWELDVHDK